MAEYIIQDTTLIDIADAIREVCDVDGTMTPEMMSEYIKVLNTPDYVKSEAARVIARVKSHQNENTFSFIAISDSHYLATNKNIVDSVIHAGQGMYLVRKGVDIDFAVNLGDNSWGSGLEGSETTIEVGKKEIEAVNKCISIAFNGIPNFRTPGNHDNLAYNYAYNDNDYLDADEIFKYFGAYNVGATFQSGEENRGYCYRDFDEWKLRVICMNTCDLKDLDPSNEESMYTSGTQMQWFAQTIDLSSKSDASDWSIIIFSHHPLDFGISILCNRILKAYLEGTSVSSFTRDGITISYDYTGKNSASIIGNIHGHNHNYLLDSLRWLVSGSTTEAIKAKRMCVPNACFSRSNERGQNGATDVFDIEFGETTTYNKSAGTAQDTSFYVITVDPIEKMVYADHYGAGYSQLWSYQKMHTNLLPIATTERDGTEIYNGIGYKTNTRIGSSGALSDYNGMCTTGWIPFKAGDVCRIQNITLEGSATPYFVRFATGATSSTSMAISYIGSPDENGIYTFVPHGSNSGHFRLSVGTISDDTIITINEEIVTDNIPLYSITNNLVNVANSNTDTSILQGKIYSAELAVNRDYILDTVTVEMGGIDITASSYSNGIITIPEVTGDIVITATATAGNWINQVPISETGDGTGIYNDIGYKNGTYLSSNGGNVWDAPNTAYTATGFIPYTLKDDGTFPTIYIKGLSWVAESHSRLFFYELNSGVRNLIFSDNSGANTMIITGNNSYMPLWFTMEELGSNYWKLTPTSELSSYNNIESIRFSLKGTGENLTVTLDEPIE